MKVRNPAKMLVHSADAEFQLLAHLSHSAIDRFTAGTGPSLYARNPPETADQLERRRSSRKEPFAGDRESRLGARTGSSALAERTRVFDRKDLR
jgi:hypothetical protein